MSDPGERPPKIFLTGKVGVGKTTILTKVIGALKTGAGGFVTERVLASPGPAASVSAVPSRARAGSRRPGLGVVGFSIRDLATGRTAPIARFEECGALRPHPEGFETVGVAAIETALEPGPRPGRGRPPPVGLIVMDELGFLEKDAPRFQAAVFRALSGPLPVIGVLKDTDAPAGPSGPDNPFLQTVKASGVLLLRVTEKNRAEVERRALAILSARKSAPPP
jgi:nucleoside-triphosphatase